MACSDDTFSRFTLDIFFFFFFLIENKLDTWTDSIERDRRFDSYHRLRNIFSRERFITRCNVWISTSAFKDRGVKVEKF